MCSKILMSMVSQVWLMNVIHAFAPLGEFDVIAISSFLDLKDTGAWTCSSKFWRSRLSSRIRIVPYEFGTFQVTLL